MRSQLLSQRQPDLTEWMDRPDCDLTMLHNTYRYFPVINRHISKWDVVYKRYLRPKMTKNRPFTLLDVGSGGGDIARRLHQWAKQEGFRLDVTGIDPDSRALDFAGSSATNGLRFRQLHITELTDTNERFDFVISNHVLHHLPDSRIPSFLKELELLATQRVICSDIERSLAGYALFSVITFPFFPKSFIRTDGLTSIRKSLTFEELKKIIPGNWQVERHFPFRLLAICDI